MTVWGKRCMENSDQSTEACSGHAHQYTDSCPAQHIRDSHCASHNSSACGEGRNSTGGRFDHRHLGPVEEQCRSRATELEDELPLGSEANSLGQGRTGDGLQPPVDKRLWSLRQHAGDGPVAGPTYPLTNSGWSSFNSDVSNLTSGSAQSAGSVEWLLQERQVDPVQVLLNLGFGSEPPTPTTMYSRIPDRFLQSQESSPSQDEEETPFVEAAPSRDPSRALAAWGRARTMSSTMMNLKLWQQTSSLGIFPTLGPASLAARSPLTGSSPSVTPPGRSRSVLHPDNQRALARQGFYGDNLPEGLELRDMARPPNQTEQEEKSRKSAEDRRKVFHKTRSKRHHSLAESGEEEGDSRSRDSLMKSVDFSTTTESTDSGELSTSAPTTPGDVFLDRAASPISAARGPVFPVDRLTNIEDLYLPERGSDVQGLHHCRQDLAHRLMSDLDNDDNYLVSRPGSRQPTVEKSATLTDSQTEDVEKDAGGGQSGRKSVTIVVSGEGNRQKGSPASSSARGYGVGGGGGAMNFLNIVNSAMDRLSDSGSEHTLVDHQSSSSGSPRPHTGSDSPQLFHNSECPRPARSDPSTGPASASTSSLRTQTPCHDGSGNKGQSLRSEPSPVLFVYHKRLELDENDNLSHAFPKQGHIVLPHPAIHKAMEDDLPRMSSVQSDSSGFGDAEVSGDNPTQEMSSLKVSSLGSSCESSVTMASTSTLPARQHSHNPTNSLRCQTESAATQTPPHFPQDTMSPQRRAQSADELRSDTERRFITTCYIPQLSRPDRAASICERSVVPKLVVPTRTSASGSGDRRGQSRISVVFGDRASIQVVSKREVRKNELPLSEELALATGPPLLAHQGMANWSTRALGRGTGYASSMDGSRGSGDELERDDRSLTYSTWTRHLTATSSRSGKCRQQQYPLTDGEDGESGTSVEGSSVYSCASTSDSIASSSGSDMLHCHKLLKLINQPTVFKGRRTRLVQYRPRRQLREWPALVKRKKLQEETRLAQYAVQKYKTELSMMETSVLDRYNLAFEDMTREEREDVEEVQHLWAEVRRQVMDTEQLLTARMKALAAGHDSFNFLNTISVLQQMIDLLKEQHFQKELSVTEEEEAEPEQEEWAEQRGGGGRRWGFRARYSSDHWASLSPGPAMRARYSSTPHLPPSPAFSDSSFDQLRTSLMSEVRDEMKTSIHNLRQDLHKRDSEIHRLQLQLMLEGCSKKPRSTQQWARSLPGSSRRRTAKETDV